MFGEVFDTTKSFTSHFTTRDRMQAVLDFPFQDAARNFASRGQAAPTRWRRSSPATTGTPTPTPTSTSCPPSSATTTWAASAASSQPTTRARATPSGVARDRLAHELMYFSRGNPVIYYGDEQGFTGPGGDQDARQTMFASQVPDYLDDDLLGTDATHAQDNFNAGPPAVPGDQRRSPRSPAAHPALRDGAHQHRYAADGPGVYAFSRIDRQRPARVRGRAQQQRAAADGGGPDLRRQARRYTRIYGDGPRRAADGRGREAHGHRAAAVRRGLRARPAASRTRKARARRSRSPRRRRPPATTAACRCRPTSAAARSTRSRSRPGRRRPLEADRHRRHRAVPGVPRRLGPDGRHARASTGPSCWTTARHTRTSRCARRPGAARRCSRSRAPAEGARRARQRRGARRRRPRAGQPRRDLRAQRGRRAVDGDRHRLLVAGLRRWSTTSSRSTSRRGRRSPTARSSPSPTATSVTSAVRTVAAAGPPATMATLRTTGAPTGDYGGLGPAHVGRRGRPGGARADRVGQAVAAHARRGRLGACTRSRW